MEDNGFINAPLRRNNIDRYYHRTSIQRVLQQNLSLLDGTLLDAGCGQMPYRAYILRHTSVTKYVGLDIETAKHYSDEVKPDVTWDGHSMPFEDNSFDCALATEVLEHVPDALSYLQEVYRVLKPGGVFLFTTPFLWPLHEIPHDEYRLTPFALERLLREAGFAQSDLQALGGWNASLAQMLGLWLRRSPMHRYLRRLLTLLSFPAYQYLIKHDEKGEFGMEMITGVAGTARKE